ncbi:hypothetical protein ACIRG4_30540 [Streptomyces sp. NPDC102395]|uniref:hypothetical protein n=1 Tax=Streptomyces sp. NPDC102395 TaxID=3366168 RepID=UPI0038205C57
MSSMMLPSAAGTRLGVTALAVLGAAGATWLAAPTAAAAPGDGADIRIHNERVPFGVSKDDPVVCRFYLDAANFGELTTVAYTIEAQPPLPTAATVTGSITLAGGAGHTDTLGLADGQYRLTWTVVGGSGPREKVFRVDCDANRQNGANGGQGNGPQGNGPQGNDNANANGGGNGNANGGGNGGGRGEDPGSPISDSGQGGHSSGGPKGGVHAGGGGLFDTMEAYTPLSAAAAVGAVVVGGAAYVRMSRRRSHGAA